MSESLTQLQREIGYTFIRPELLREAMTHKSYAAEWNVDYDNQRLEFLGDAVVQIVLTRHLYFRYSALQEGDLTKIRSALVNQDSLARFARSIQLGNYLRLGNGEIDLHGADRDSTISDAFEALCAALYLDGGYEVAEKFILELFEKNVSDPKHLLDTLNPKGALQEYAQAKLFRTPQYRVVRVTGPQHDPRYEVEVLVNGQVLAAGMAQNRKTAEQNAAEQAMKILLSQENKEEPSK